MIDIQEDAAAADALEGAQALFGAWEEAFRSDFERDQGAGFEPLLKRFRLEVDAREMLEGTVDFVNACAAFLQLDGVGLTEFLDLQRYDAKTSGATYAMTFDVARRTAARLLVTPPLKFVDLADLYEFPWYRLKMVGYSDFWFSRLDGEDLTEDEMEGLRERVSYDIRFDHTEDEVLFFDDPDNYPGALWFCVYDTPPEAREAAGDTEDD